VLTGAGISTSLGIPDFRSKETGLYSKLAHLGLSDPQEVFDIEIFREDPSIFYSIARDILPDSNRFSPTHAFIALLQEKGKLLTNFSQNIDNLEAAAGIRPDKLVQCHGSFATASCVKCRHQVPGDTIREDLQAARVAHCPRCIDNLAHLAAQRKPPTKKKKKRKRASRDHSHSTSKDRRRPSLSSLSPPTSPSCSPDDDDDDNIPSPGIMKPDITFFGEDLPATFHERLVQHDRALVDLVIVIGTSLKVAPVSEVVGFLPKDVPQVYISRTVSGRHPF
jgi:NAD-dependent histone deacetylase SIR2